MIFLMQEVSSVIWQQANKKEPNKLWSVSNKQQPISNLLKDGMMLLMSILNVCNVTDFVKGDNQPSIMSKQQTWNKKPMQDVRLYENVECVKLLEMAISLHIQNNRISNVAKIQKRIA